MWVLNGLKHTNHSEQCLAQSKNTIRALECTYRNDKKKQKEMIVLWGRDPRDAERASFPRTPSWDVWELIPTYVEIKWQRMSLRISKRGVCVTLVWVYVVTEVCPYVNQQTFESTNLFTLEFLELSMEALLLHPIPPSREVVFFHPGDLLPKHRSQRAFMRPAPPSWEIMASSCCPEETWILSLGTWGQFWLWDCGEVKMPSSGITVLGQPSECP